MTHQSKTGGYIWYNPDKEVYQYGPKQEFEALYNLSGHKEFFSLILKLTPTSEILAYKIVRELNIAKSNPEEALKLAI